MKQKIITFTDYKNNSKLNLEDIFNLFLIYKHNEGMLESFDLNIIELSLARYKHSKRFNSLLEQLKIEMNGNDEEIINLNKVVDQKVNENAIMVVNNYVLILGSDKYFDNLKAKYNKEVFSSVDTLMFSVNNDLKYGFDNWELLFEDEYIENSIYSGVITGEFIGQKKDKKVMKKVRKWLLRI